MDRIVRIVKHRVIWILLLIAAINVPVCCASLVNGFSYTPSTSLACVSLHESDLVAEIDMIENRLGQLEVERKVWGSYLDISNVLYAGYMTLIIFLFGLLTNALFSKRLRKMEHKISETISELQYRTTRNELLQYRALYFTYCSIEMFSTAFLWGVRFIVKLHEQGMTQSEDSQVLVDFTRNVIELYQQEIVGEGFDYSPEEVMEVINCLNQIRAYEVKSDQLDIDMSVKAILCDLHSKASDLIKG